MSGVFISNNAPPRIGLNQYARNGLSPIAEFQNIISERVGYAVRVRAKMVWRSAGHLYSAGASVIPASSASERTRWRFPMHAAPYARTLCVRMWQARTAESTSCYSRLRLTNAAGTLIGDATRYYGSSGTYNDTPNHFGDSTLGLLDTDGELVDLPAGEACFGTFADFANARLVAACVWEIAHDPNTDEGYPDVNAGSGSPIYDKDRFDVARMANAQWSRGAQPLWCYSSDTDATARTRAVAGYINLIDNSSTAVSAATPGVQLDLRYRTTLSRSALGVPVRFVVYAANTAGTGEVRILNSAGATLLTSAISGTTATWYTTNGYLPAADAKYDAHFGGNATGTLTVYAFGIYEYDGDSASAVVPAETRAYAYDATSSM